MSRFPHIILSCTRNFCNPPLVSVYQNVFASKPSIRNRPKTENFKSYEDLGRIRQPVFREHSEEEGLGPIPRVDECAKLGAYKNPEYFCYHHYSYYDFEVGMKCMHLPQPSALDEQDLVTMVRKSCCGAVGGDHSGRMCPPPPPQCSVDGCVKERSSGVDVEDGGGVVLLRGKEGSGPLGDTDKKPVHLEDDTVNQALKLSGEQTIFIKIDDSVDKKHDE